MGALGFHYKRCCSIFSLLFPHLCSVILIMHCRGPALGFVPYYIQPAMCGDKLGLQGLSSTYYYYYIIILSTQDLATQSLITFYALTKRQRGLIIPGNK